MSVPQLTSASKSPAAILARVLDYFLEAKMHCGSKEVPAMERNLYLVEVRLLRISF